MIRKIDSQTNEEVHHCDIIDSQPTSFYFQKGTGAGQRVLILGESLARNGWVESGRAFYTTSGKIVPTGKKLNEELALLDLSFQICAFTEAAKCYIGKNRKILKTCGRRCGNHLISQLKANRIKIILSLGVITKEVLETIFEKELPMGEVTKLNYARRKFIVLPLYHPSPASPFGHKRNLAIIAKVKNQLKNHNYGD